MSPASAIRIAYYVIIKAYTSSTGPILASGIDSMQNQHQHNNTVCNVIDVEHSAKESLTRHAMTVRNNNDKSLITIQYIQDSIANIMSTHHITSHYKSTNT